MGSKEQIIQLRKDNPLMNSKEIGKAVGNISRQYVHKILRGADLNTNVPRKRKFKRCLICSNPTPTKAKVCP